MGISAERKTPIRANLKCLLICLFVSMANCQYGFDTATVGGESSHVDGALAVIWSPLRSVGMMQA
jgi:hypothetical protein